MGFSNVLGNKFILTAGMSRSGSTLLFNMVRLLCKETGCLVYSTYYRDYQADRQCEWTVIKLHGYLDSFHRKADFIFTPRRDMRDAVASAIRIKGIPNTRAAVEAYADKIIRLHHGAWREHSDYEIPYELVIWNKRPHLVNIASVLGIDVDIDRVLEKIDAIKGNGTEDGYDNETIMLHNHITDGRVGSFRDQLSAETVEFLNEKYSEWLCRYGYLEE